jgi:hypothetical protein
MPCLVQTYNPEGTLSQGKTLGFDWLVVHNGMGFRCGYVRIPPNHPWHGKGWEDLDCEVHGGITFASPDSEDDSWWIGFDCAHFNDAADPSLPRNSLYPTIRFQGTIRTTEYVESECQSLCQQAALAIA